MQCSPVINTGALATPEPDSDNEAEETFCTETSGVEDEEAFDRARLEGQLVKEEEWDAGEEAGAVITLHVEDTPCTKSRPVPQNMLHVPTLSHTLVALGAPDEEEACLQTLSPHREHTTEWLSQTLLE